MVKQERLFGLMGWCGVFKGLPAVVGSYYNGASLYVFKGGSWHVYAKGSCDRDVTPRMCPECGAILPLENRF